MKRKAMFFKSNLEWAEFDYLNSPQAFILVSTYSGNNVIYDLGDGNYETLSSNVRLNYTYGFNYTGKIKFAVIGGSLSDVKRLDFGTGNNTTNLSNPQLTWSQMLQVPNLSEFFWDYSTVSRGSVSGNYTGALLNSLEYLNLIENNGVFNINLEDLPSSVYYLNLSVVGSSTVTGNIENLAFISNIQHFAPYGNSTIAGNISAFSSSPLTFFRVSGANTISGTLDDLPNSVLNLTLSGQCTVSGTPAGLPVNLITLSLGGQNTFGGDISGFPNSVTTITLTGNNTLTGNIANAPTAMTAILLIGSNTLFGDLFNLPVNTVYVNIAGLNTISDYTSGRTWANNMRLISLTRTGNTMTSTEIDNLLIDLSNVTTWVVERSIDLRGGNSPRTAASDAAVTTLISKGVTVLTN